MAALSADRKYKTRWQGRLNSIPMLANAIAFQGALVSVNASGLGIAATTTAGTRVVGVCMSKADNTGGADSAISAHVMTGDVYLDNDATNPITQADVGRICYVKDDHTVQTIVGGSVVAGRVQSVDASGVWVTVDPEIGTIGGGRVDTVADSNTTMGVPGVHVFLIPDAAAADYDITLKEKFEVTDVTVIKDGAGAANTITVKSTAAAITDAIASAVDKAVTRAGTIDKANSTIAIGGILRCSATRAAGSSAAKVIVSGIRRA